MSIIMRDYKYFDLITRKPEWEECMKALYHVRSKALEPIADAFGTNLQRITNFSVMPAEITAKALRDQHIWDYAVFQAIGKIEPGLTNQIEIIKSAKGDAEKVDEIFKRETEKLKTEPPETHYQLKAKLGVEYIEQQLKQEAGIRESMEAILSSVIVESWTAFESLAGDLWVAGVDNEPGEAVARLISNAKNLKQPDDNVRPETVFRTGLNPKTHYGSFLRAIGAVSFQTLWEIRKFYGIAFESEATRLFDEIDGGYIEVLSAFRNALTHAGGRADKKFRGRLTGRFPEFDTIKEGDPILLDGQLANRLHVVAAQLGSSLIAHIDNILSPTTSGDDDGS